MFGIIFRSAHAQERISHSDMSCKFSVASLSYLYYINLAQYLHKRLNCKISRCSDLSFAFAVVFNAQRHWETQPALVMEQC
jgi:hypothetical protein